MEQAQPTKPILGLRFGCSRTRALFETSKGMVLQTGRTLQDEVGEKTKEASEDRNFEASVEFQAITGPDGIITEQELKDIERQTEQLRKITPVHVVPHRVARLSAVASPISEGLPLAADRSLLLDLTVKVDLTTEVCCICRCELAELEVSVQNDEANKQEMKGPESCPCTKTTGHGHVCPLGRLGRDTVLELFSAILQDQKLQSDDHSDVIVRLSRCTDHYFHLPCLLNLMASSSSASNAQGTNELPRWLRCPICLVIYGQRTGDQPPGVFQIEFDEYLSCDGWSSEAPGTLIINYHFPHGLRPDGTPYRGTYRTAYLPNCERGRSIALMLQIAFDRKVTFTVGTSLTTGQKNVVVWNSIHHKTSPSGGPTCYGYPDPTYFDRVELELAANGVYPEDVTDDMKASLDALIQTFSSKPTRPFLRPTSSKKKSK